MARRGTVFSFGPSFEFELDVEFRELRREGSPVSLQLKPVEVLLHLLAHRERLVSKEELLDAVWPEASVSEASLTTALAQIRAALGDSGREERFIRTYRGRGYRFVGTVEERTGRESDREDGTSATRNRRTLVHARRRLVALAAMGAALAGAAALWGLWTPREPPIRSIAVLPLQNLSGDPAEDYFADGMTEDLIGALSEIRALRVPSHRSVLRFKGTHEPLPKIAETLDVDALIEGTVRREGNTLRVTIQLVQGAQDRHLWHEQYDEDTRSVLELQGRIAQDVARRVDVTLRPGESEQFAAKRPVVPAAYDLYLRARHIDRVRHGWSSPQTVDLLERAVAIDPEFADAHWWLAVSYRNLAMYGFAPPGEALNRARALTNRAVALGRVRSAHELGWIALFEWRFGEAERVWRKFLAAGHDPTRPSVTASHLGLGMLASVQGRPEGLEQMRRAIALKPHPFFVQFPIFVGEMEARHRRYDAAISRARALLEAEPSLLHGHVVLWAAYSWKGDFDAAVSAWAELTRRLGSDPRPIQEAYRESGIRAAVEVELAFQLERRKNAYVSASQIAERYAALGDREGALHWLERAHEERDPQLIFAFNLNPTFDAVRDDPRFSALAKRVGLPLVAANGPLLEPLPR